MTETPETPETIFLKFVNIKQSSIAKALGSSPQAVSKGIKKAQEGGLKGKPYLDEKRLRKIYSYLSETDPAKMQEFADKAVEHLKVKPSAFFIEHKAVPNDPAQTQDFKELWIFSCRPLELDSAYLEDMRSWFKTGADGKRKRIAYFAPPEITKTLKALFKRELGKIPPNNRNEIIVVESPSVAFSPHYVIFNPMDDNRKGLVAIMDESRLQKLPNDQVVSIVDSLKQNGIGVDESDLVLQVEEDGDELFTEVFNSNNLIRVQK